MNICKSAIITAAWWLGHPSEKYESIGLIIPNIWKNKIHVPVTTNQKNLQPGKSTKDLPSGLQNPGTLSIPGIKPNDHGKGYDPPTEARTICIPETKSL